MKDHSSHLQILGQLAREYEQKYSELKAFLDGTPASKTLFQIRALSERTTDRFRSAQMALLSEPDFLDAEGRENARMAATAMCRAFDEMRILFQFLVELCPAAPAAEDK